MRRVMACRTHASQRGRVIALPWTPRRAKPQKVIHGAIATTEGTTTAAAHHQQANRERLIKAIVKPRGRFDALSTGRIEGIDGIAMREGKSARNIRMMIQLAFLAPSIVEAVVERRLPATIGAAEIVRDLPMAWTEQRAVLGV